MTDPTPRDRALAGEVVKVTDERLAEMQRIAIDNEDAGTYSMHWHWASAITELIAARKEIERLKAERAPAVGFSDLPPRPQRPARILDVAHATSEEARAHYMMMANYWIAEAHWQGQHAAHLTVRVAELEKALASTDTVPRSRYDACNRDWLAAENECTRIAARAKEEIERLTARVAELEKERDASAEDTRAMQERLQRAVQGAMTLRRALDIIVNIRPLGGPTYPECYSRMRAVALDALGDDGPPGPKHPPRVPGHNPVA